MTRILAVFALAIGLALPAPGSATAGPAPKGPHLLTISGDVLDTNRPASDPFRDAYFEHQGLSFERAFAFDAAMLSKLKQHKVRANSFEFPSRVVASGPRLEDVLDQAGVRKDAAITVYALDGYAITFSPEERAETQYILAIEADDRPLAVGGRGPLWLLHDTGDRAVTEDDEAKWVWAVYYIETE